MAFEFRLPDRFPVWVRVEGFTKLSEEEIKKQAKSKLLLELKKELTVAKNLKIKRISLSKENVIRIINSLNQWIYNYFDLSYVPKGVPLFDRERNSMNATFDTPHA